MSHVATIDLEVRDLDVLAAACPALGLEFVRDQKTYHWYGMSVGDYPLPEGFEAGDLGKCEHAIRVKDFDGNRKCDDAPYEIGIVRRRDGRPGYTLLWDFFAGGMGLEKKVGKNCGLLKQAYALGIAKKTAMAQGFTVNEQRQQDGTVVLRMTK